MGSDNVIHAVSVPLTSLIPGTRYYYRVVSSSPGGTMPGTVQYFYASDTTPPTVGSGAPGAGGTGVGLDNTIGATFSEAIDCSTVTSESFSVRTSSGFVLGDLVCTGGTVTFTPWANLLPATAYTVTVAGGAGGVKDLAGNPVAADYSWTFTTGTTPLGPAGSIVAVDASGSLHSLALSGDGHVWGWGYNGDGELGVGSIYDGSVVPVMTVGPGGTGTLDNVVAVSAGIIHSLALLSDGTVRAWGGGFLGDNTYGSSSSPVQVVGPDAVGVLDNVVAVSAGGAHSLALVSDGTVWAWGYNANGELGVGSPYILSNVPVRTVGPGGAGTLNNVVAVSAGYSHSLALLSDGTLWAWGANESGQLGANTFDTTSSSPVQVVGPGGVGILDNVVAVSAGNFHSLALLSDGTVRAWGGNWSGQLGANTFDDYSSSPVQVVGPGGLGILGNVVAVSAGESHSLALLSDGTVWAWGGNWSGQLGDNTFNNASPSPVQVTGPGGVGVLGTVVAVSAGWDHSLALLSDGTVRAWGHNSYGGLGDGTIFDHAAPVGTSPPGLVVPNGPPVADAGLDNTVPTGTTVQLDGTGSTDPDGDPLTYQWYLYAPDGSSAVLSSATSPTPTFVVDLPGDYYADLYVSDGKTISYASVTITTNRAPMANAGPDNTVTTGATVVLDGSASVDPDGDTVTYSWAFASIPVGSTATLTGETTSSPSFTADVTGSYTITLTVSDGISSASDNVVITASSSGPWQPTSTTGAPTGRDSHTVVWTGSGMIVWGGYEDSTGTYVNTGGRYDPATDSWLSTSTTGAPTGRGVQTAAWTGSGMIVWGGYEDSTGTYVNTGGLYDPATDSWLSTSIASAPVGRESHTAVWTGSAMIVWGGFDFTGTMVNTGGRYDPATDSWLSTSTTGAPTGRVRHTAVWTGSAMIVWGGWDSTAVRMNTGGRYDPATDSWLSTSTTGAPAGRNYHTAVWTGSAMIVWGGYDSTTMQVNTGGRYDPATNSWTATSTGANVPQGRASHTAVWTGSRMIVWGGSGSTYTYVNTGGRYDPATDTWQLSSTAGAPTAKGIPHGGLDG